MSRRKGRPTPPPVGEKPDIKPNTWDARLYQTSDLAMRTIEHEQADMREKTKRLREARLKSEKTRAEDPATAPTPDKIAQILSRMKRNMK